MEHYRGAALQGSDEPDARLDSPLLSETERGLILLVVQF